MVKAAAAGELSPAVNPRLQARLQLGMVNSVVEWFTVEGEVGVGELQDNVVEMVFRGISAR
jgi:hypothetical protein